MKTHLADSDVPLTEGSDQEAICKTLVKKAAFVLSGECGYNWTMYDELTRVSGLCRRCWRSAATMKNEYVYAIASGEEMKQAEDGND